MENIYSAPNADLSNAPEDEDTYQPKMWALSGRLGRIRYLAYLNLTMIMLMFPIGILASVMLPSLARNGSGSPMFIFALYIPIFAVSIIYAKRRLNDLDHSGWWSILIFIPLVNILIGLYLVFGPGTPGSNRFGKQANKNPTWLFLAIFFPIMLIGVLAAVSIPAYQKYTERAKAAAARTEMPMPSNQGVPEVPGNR
ncbi:DUF805 domain-containing protein [Undibacterium sp. Di24W]|uniref:DUF805 domain-containing protein n=1 Tax=Undibacterium sp. Di24W TaxID=3413033 RepID=UPI003BEF5410